MLNIYKYVCVWVVCVCIHVVVRYSLVHMCVWGCSGVVVHAYVDACGVGGYDTSRNSEHGWMYTLLK